MIARPSATRAVEGRLCFACAGHDGPRWAASRGMRMDQISRDARRLATIGTFFIVAGWVFVIYALVAGALWWIDLAQSDTFNILTALAISAAAVGLPVFAALLVGGLGYAMRLFALYVASKASSS